MSPRPSFVRQSSRSYHAIMATCPQLIHNIGDGLIDSLDHLADWADLTESGFDLQAEMPGLLQDYRPDLFVAEGAS